MKKLLVVLFASLSSCIFAQSSILKFTPGDSLTAKFDKALDEYLAKGFIKNISPSTIRMVWKRTYLNTDESCNTLVCDNFNCYQSWVSFSPKVIELKTNDSSNIDLHFEVGCCEPGPTTLMMDFYLVGDTSNSLVNIHYNCGVITKIDYLEAPEFSIQPNPASDVLQLKFLDNSVEPFTYEILSLAGVSMRNATVSGITTAIALDGLPAGIYFLRLRQGLKATEPRKFVVVKDGK